jgi:hypothetical protein
MSYLAFEAGKCGRTICRLTLDLPNNKQLFAAIGMLLFVFAISAILNKGAQ